MDVSRARMTAWLGVAPVLIAGVLLVGCPKQPPEETVKTPAEEPSAAPKEGTRPMEPGVRLRYFGHACFLATDSKGRTVAIDPFDAKVGYAVPQLEAEVCLVTHDHFDHSNTAAVAGSPRVVREAGETDALGIPVVGVSAAHHEPGKNEERGDVVMFRWTMDGLSLVHVGDLGDSLSPDQIEALGPADVLMVPVGGVFTIDANKAVQAAQDLKAKFVIPMHHKTDATKPDLPIAPVADFLQILPGEWLLTQSEVASVTITKAEVDRADAPIRVIVLGYQ
ncbi:MAG: MBL fold metallo-hydrolase [Armatimonadetes bacterium]|nr:MBL fold metallo-hydrolase [Armatimonadota bacterium]